MIGPAATDTWLTPAQAEALRPAYWTVTVSIDGPDGTAIQSVEIPHSQVQTHGYDALDQPAFEMVDQLVAEFRTNDPEA